VEKFWLLTSTSSVTGEENNFLFPSLKGGKLFGENCLLLVVNSALKSQRRVRCEFGVICFLEIDFLLPEIN
jgi:hypothetical protein